MKYALSIFFLIFSFGSNAQNYLDETCIWKIKDYAYVDLVYFNSDYYDYINGDTLIGGVDYFKLYRKGTVISGFTQTDSMFINEIDDYKGAIREENKTWIWIEKDSVSPIVLYDFNLTEGDSMKFNQGMSNYNLVLADSILHDGFYKRVYNLEGTVIDLIEGVGFITGPILPLLKFESISYIQCFSKGRENLNPDLSGFESILADGLFEDLESCEELLSSNTNQNTYEQDIVIFPNPTNDFLNVNLKNSKAKTISILNLEGKELFRKVVNNQLIELEVNDLEKGIYFLKIRMEDRVFVEKFIKYKN